MPPKGQSFYLEFILQWQTQIWFLSRSVLFSPYQSSTSISYQKPLIYHNLIHLFSKYCFSSTITMRLSVLSGAALLTNRSYEMVLDSQYLNYSIWRDRGSCTWAYLPLKRARPRVTPKPPNLTRVPPFPPSQTYSRTDIFLAKLLKGYDINPDKEKDHINSILT